MFCVSERKFLYMKYKYIISLKDASSKEKKNTRNNKIAGLFGAPSDIRKEKKYIIKYVITMRD